MQIFTIKRTGISALLKTHICLVFLLFVVLHGTVFAQERFTFSGYLRDATSGEALIYATIYPETLKTGVSTNEYGFFSITLPKGKYNIIFSYIGYQTIKKGITFDKNLHENISLTPKETNIEEITIFGIQKINTIQQIKFGTCPFIFKDLSPFPFFLESRTSLN